MGSHSLFNKYYNFSPKYHFILLDEIIAVEPRIILEEEDKGTVELDDEECEEYEDIEVSAEEDDTDDETQGSMKNIEDKPMMKSTEGSFTIVDSDLGDIDASILMTTGAPRQKRDVTYVFTFLCHYS